VDRGGSYQLERCFGYRFLTVVGQKKGRTDLRGQIPMVVEEDSPGACEGEAARTHRCVADDGLYS
jgi:hypothetical protein